MCHLSSGVGFSTCSVSFVSIPKVLEFGTSLITDFQTGTTIIFLQIFVNISVLLLSFGVAEENLKYSSDFDLSPNLFCLPLKIQQYREKNHLHPTLFIGEL
jgi:hypothetical protein